MGKVFIRHIVQFIIITAGFWLTGLVTLTVNYSRYQNLGHTEARVVYEFKTHYYHGIKHEAQMVYEVEGVGYHFSTTNQFLDRKYYNWDVVPLVYDPANPQRAWIDSFMGYWYQDSHLVVTALIGFIWFGFYYLYLLWRTRKNA